MYLFYGSILLYVGTIVVTFMKTQILLEELTEYLISIKTRQNLYHDPIYKIIKVWAKKWGYWKNAPRHKGENLKKYRKEVK